MLFTISRRENTLWDHLKDIRTEYGFVNFTMRFIPRRFATSYIPIRIREHINFLREYNFSLEKVVSLQALRPLNIS